jgi:hypothetical protein
VAFSLAAWAPVFAGLSERLGAPIFRMIFPDWKEAQGRAVRAVCMAPENEVWVAVDGDRPPTPARPAARADVDECPRSRPARRWGNPPEWLSLADVHGVGGFPTPELVHAAADLAGCGHDYADRLADRRSDLRRACARSEVDIGSARPPGGRRTGGALGVIRGSARRQCPNLGFP